MLNSKLKPFQPTCCAAQRCGHIRVFMEYYHGWLDVWTHLTKAAATRKHHYKSIIRRFSNTLPATMSSHYTHPTLNLQRKQLNKTQSRERGESKAHCNSPFMARGNRWGMTVTGHHLTYTSHTVQVT